MDRVRVVKAEVFLVFLIAIVFLNKGVCVDAVLPIRTFLFSFDELTQLSCIKITIAFPIFGVMIIYAVLVIVVFAYVTRVDFEIVQVEMLDKQKGTLTMGAVWN